MSFLFGGREVSCYRDGGVKLGEIVEVQWGGEMHVEVSFWQNQVKDQLLGLFKKQLEQGKEIDDDFLELVDREAYDNGIVRENFRLQEEYGFEWLASAALLQNETIKVLQESSNNCEDAIRTAIIFGGLGYSYLA